MKISQLLSMAVLFTGVSAVAAIPAEVTFKGKVGNFDENTVLFKTDTGEVKIPRKAFGKEDIRPGKEMTVKANLAEVVRANQSR